MHNPEGACRHLLTRFSESGARDEMIMSVAGALCSGITPTSGMDAKRRFLNEITARQRTAPHPDSHVGQVPNQREQRICATPTASSSPNSQENRPRC